jgi:hypothetical protein
LYIQSISRGAKQESSKSEQKDTRQSYADCPERRLSALRTEHGNHGVCYLGSGMCAISGLSQLAGIRVGVFPIHDRELEVRLEETQLT